MARNIFVTGATSGIGLCIAEAYAKHGDNVLICIKLSVLLGKGRIIRSIILNENPG